MGRSGLRHIVARSGNAMPGIVLLAALAASSRAPAQEEHGLAPIEVLVCDFVDGKSPADLTGLADGFNAWMERSDAPAYAAYTLSPLSHSDEIRFDLAWVGAWPDATTMGASMAHYFTHGADLGPVFGSVMDCNDNTNYAVLTLSAPANPASFGPLSVATCTVSLRSTTEEALDALSGWVRHEADEGSDAANWVLFPAYGERSDASYSFKWAIGYGSYESFGRDYERFANAGGADRYDELTAASFGCDVPRLYSVTTIRPPER